MNNLSAIDNWVDEIFPLRELVLKGRVFSYREKGSLAAPAIVLLHGIGSASGSWAYQVHDLSESYRLIAWDAPGYGASTALPEDAPIAADYAVALTDFLAALDVEPDIIIGHSLGALMAAAYAVAGGAIGTALVLVDPANGYGAADKAVRDEKLVARLANMDKLGPEGLAAARASALLSADASPEALALVRWNMSRLKIDGHAQAAHMLAYGHLMGDAAKYAGPVLVMCGGVDTVTPEEGCRKISAAFQNAEYRTLPGVGHASYVENPAQFNKAILKFVGGLTPNAENTLSEAKADVLTQKYVVPGLQRGLQILRIFNRDRTEVGAPEIARELRIPRSTVFRLMQTLEYMGLLEKVNNSSDYRLGVGVLSLGFEFLASLEVTEVAQPVLQKLRDETGFSTHLVIRDGWDVVFVVKAAAKTTFASSVNIGTRLPAHGTVLGRMLLADLSEDELKQVYPSGKLSEFSDQTPTTLSELTNLLEQDRKRGYAISEAYFENGIGSVAAPVRDFSRRVIAAINVTYQDGTIKRSDVKGKILKNVLQAAEELSRQLDYRADIPNISTNAYMNKAL